MKFINYKNVIFYVAIIGGFSALIYWIVLSGMHLEQGKNIQVKVTDVSLVDGLIHNLKSPLTILLAQIITIIIVAKMFGWLCNRIKQPSVVGEMIAGIVLGPSLIGSYFPEFSATLFPKQSLGNLQFLSQIGLILFMFIVGMELDLKVLKNKAKDAVVISHASIIVPFALGIGLAYFMYTGFAPEGVPFLSFGLFMGIAMSITAMPVLARIVQERGLQKTRLGTIVITCAAADDITAWCILAVVIAIVKAGSIVSSLYTIILAVTYVFMMIKVVRPFLKRVGDLHASRESLNKPIVALFLVMLIISAYTTEAIGIHALFGAFMAGGIMPENVKFRNLFVEKVEDVALVLLLPLFFVFTGLRTEIGLLNDPSLWKLAGLIIVVAVTGKFLGSTLAAKFVGQDWKDSLSIGALMNTRGLMELVVLNIGYDLGVLTPAVFSMMVIMALVTTFMTGPALDLINRAFRSKQATALSPELKESGKYKILFSFGKPESGKALLKLANDLTQKLNGNATLTAMHVSPVDEIHQYDMAGYEKENFQPVIDQSLALNRKITTLYKASTDIDNEIIDVANTGNYDLLLIGFGESIYEGTLFGKVLGFTTRIINPEKILNTVTGRENMFDNSPFEERTRHILAKSKIPVGVLLDKNFTQAQRIFIPLFTVQDNFLIMYAQKLIHNNGAQVVLLDAEGQIKNNNETKEKIRAIEQMAPNHITLQSQRGIESDFLKQQDLMLVSLESWKKLVEREDLWLPDIPSTLIISEKPEQLN